MALAFTVRDRLTYRWAQTQETYSRTDAKRVYYLSLEFLLGRLLANNILNLGATGAHRDAMRANIARLAGIGTERVGVKATTTEKLGFTGREEGIAALATILLVSP